MLIFLRSPHLLASVTSVGGGEFTEIVAEKCRELKVVNYPEASEDERKRMEELLEFHQQTANLYAQQAKRRIESGKRIEQLENEIASIKAADEAYSKGLQSQVTHIKREVDSKLTARKYANITGSELCSYTFSRSAANKGMLIDAKAVPFYCSVRIGR